MIKSIDSLLINIVKIKDGFSFGLRSKIFFLRELAYLVQGGLSMIQAVNIIKENTDNSVLKGICDSIYDSLKKGETLHRCLIRIPKHFNNGDVNIIKSGENSGELPKVLTYLANEYSFLYETRNKYIGAMLYPIIVFLVSIIAIIILVKFILPSILSIVFEFDNVTLPWTTKFLIFVVNFFENYSSSMLIFLIFIVFALSITLSVPEGRKVVQMYIIKFPIIGKLTRYYLLIKFLRYLKLLVFAGLNYVDIFKLMSNIMGNGIYTQMNDEILQELRKGGNFTDVLMKYTLIIPRDVTVLLKVGQETASLSNAIENAVWLYEEEFNKMMDNLSKIIEPILIVGVGGVVAIIALSVFGIIGTVLDSVQNSF